MRTIIDILAAAAVVLAASACVRPAPPPGPVPDAYSARYCVNCTDRDGVLSSGRRY